MALMARLEAALVRAGFALSRWLGPVRASNLGGWITRTAGPRLPVSGVGRRNLAMAFPDMPSHAREAILRGVWDNLGRTIAEMPHVGDLRPTGSGPGFEWEGLQHVPSRGPMILVSGHLGNWEVLPVAAFQAGLRMASFYRAPANPDVAALVAVTRERASGAPTFAKGAKGAREAMAWLRGGGALGLVMDQKMNDGVEARLFGQPAMTATAAASFALRYGCPIIPGRTIRLGPARFRVVVDPPLVFTPSGDRPSDLLGLTQAINDRIEEYIRDQPDQWLWLHRRWPKEVTAGLAAQAAAPSRSAPPPPRPRT